MESCRIPVNDNHYYPRALIIEWRQKHGKVLLHFLLELCQDGTISEGNVTDEAWLGIQNGLNNSTNCSFEIDFLKERLHDYKQLYSLLAETSSQIFHWDHENKTISINSNMWREYHPKLLLCGPYIPYFDTLEAVCLLLRRRDLPSTMKISVKTLTGKVLSLECKSTDTVEQVKVKIKDLEGIPTHQQKIIFEGEHLIENMTLYNCHIQDGSLFYLALVLRGGGAGGIEKPRTPKDGYLYRGDEFKSGWREEHGKELLHLLLKFCQDGTISHSNVTQEAWCRIQNGLQNLTNCTFEIDFLEERLCDFKQLYSLLAKTSSQIFDWDREHKTICINSNMWREYHPKLLLCGPCIPYFDTLEVVCLLLRRSSETSINIKKPEKPVHQDNDNRDLPSTMKISVKTLVGKVFSLECKSTDTVEQVKVKLQAIHGYPPGQQSLYFGNGGAPHSLQDHMMLDDYHIQEGSVLYLWFRSEDRPSTMKISVTTLTGKVFSLECKSRDTVEQVKIKLQAIHGFPPGQQKLYFGGQSLHDNMMLDNYHIKEGSVIHLLFWLGEHVEELVDQDIPQHSNIRTTFRKFRQSLKRWLTRTI